MNKAKLAVLNNDKIEVLLEALVDQGYTNQELQKQKIDTLTHINDRQTVQWRHYLRTKKISAIFGFIGLLTSLLNVALVAIGLYYLPNETKLLFNTLKDFIGF